MDCFEEIVEIVNKRGLHARASARLAREAGGVPARVFVEKDGVKVTATSIMGLMMLGAAKGDTVKIIAEGREAVQSGKQIASVIADRFGEAE